MKVIGLTGGIGSGKSTVAKFLEELGAIVIDADKVGHEAFKPGSNIWREVVEAFGRDILDEKEQIDRERLGKKVFGNAEAMSRLNRIMHPRLHEVVRRTIEEYRAKGVEMVVVEATLLVEAGWRDLVDEVWVTIAPKAVVVKRVMERSGLTGEQVRARLKSQVPPRERIKYADVVIETDCPLSEVKEKTFRLWDRLKTAKD